MTKDKENKIYSPSGKGWREADDPLLGYARIHSEVLLRRNAAKNISKTQINPKKKEDEESLEVLHYSVEKKDNDKFLDALSEFEKRQNCEIGYGEEVDGEYLIEFPSEQMLALQAHMKNNGFFEQEDEDDKQPVDSDIGKDSNVDEEEAHEGAFKRGIRKLFS